jgi:hypothetical protein
MTKVLMYGKFEDTKGVIRSRKPKKDIQYNGQVKKDKQRSTKHCTENMDKLFFNLYLFEFRM